MKAWIYYKESFIKLHSGWKFHIEINFFGAGIDIVDSIDLFNVEKYGSYKTKRQHCSYYSDAVVWEQRNVLQKVGLLNYRIGQEYGIARRGPNQTTLIAGVI